MFSHSIIIFTCTGTNVRSNKIVKDYITKEGSNFKSDPGPLYFSYSDNNEAGSQCVDAFNSIF